MGHMCHSHGSPSLRDPTRLVTRGFCSTALTKLYFYESSRPRACSQAAGNYRGGDQETPPTNRLLPLLREDGKLLEAGIDLTRASLAIRLRPTVGMKDAHSAD
ncbi:hypothetical protein KIN20_011386 [Parelaphostrongylus tenuis]|uniref:Uncharacterized protein n=1 Tax=Parelaphostrongylus tenuis TaxID=148309 RepID=A0AAD5QJL8_PARTN|nr:hypothetical protein KIN20_011386 [Parelaphostrongylus tenuis]